MADSKGAVADSKLSTKAAAAKPTPIYHEKQSLQRCGVHTANNLLQSAFYTPADFDAICVKLDEGKSFINPHKSMLGTGNYDISVLETAFIQTGMELRWFDRRKPLSSIDYDKISGFVLNELQSVLFGLTSTNHWIPVRAIDGVWYNLDSKAAAPKPYADRTALQTHLTAFLKSKDNQLLILCQKELKSPYVDAAAAAAAAEPAKPAASAAAPSGDAKSNTVKSKDDELVASVVALSLADK